MKVTLSLMANDSVSQDPVKIPQPDELTELIPGFPGKTGCFCTPMPNDFNPPLPNCFCAKNTSSGTV